MEMSIGDIADRYSICKLKIERTDVDFTEEFQELQKELNDYDNIKEYVDRLYEINGKIWDLEYDIRRGKDRELGLEEVGKRAIKIREYNGKRVQTKNEINVITNTGFQEKKVNHASQLENQTIEKNQDDLKVVVTLTTVPERLDNPLVDAVPSVIVSLCNQDFEYKYEVHFNIPYTHKIKNKPYTIPQWLITLQEKYENLKVYRTEDYGPCTKVIPTIERITNQDTIIVVLDDDFVYHKDTIKEHYKFQKEFNNCAIGYDGLGVSSPKYGDSRDRFVALVNENTKVDCLQHYRTVSYKRRFFENDFFDLFVGKTLSDDILTSYYMRYKNIDMYVVPIPNHNHIDSLEEWSQKISVPTFPLVRPAESIKDSGANDPEALKIQPKFYVPKEYEDLLVKTNYGEELYDLAIKYETDKGIPHNYTYFYHNYFKNKKQKFKKILEIGVYNGGSLRMWRDYFLDSTIYGLDIQKLEINEDRIVTQVVDQSDRRALFSFTEILDFSYFDLIIDDGSHIMKDQQISLAVLFKKLRPGGVYIIEDLHTSMDIHENRFGLRDSKYSTYEVLSNYNKNNVIRSNWMTEEEIDYLNANIDTVELYVPKQGDIFASCCGMIHKKY